MSPPSRPIKTLLILSALLFVAVMTAILLTQRDLDPTPPSPRLNGLCRFLMTDILPSYTPQASLGEDLSSAPRPAHASINALR